MLFSAIALVGGLEPTPLTAQDPATGPAVAELPHVEEDDAPGIDAYRQGLDALVAKRTVKRLPHDEIIGQLDCG